MRQGERPEQLQGKPATRSRPRLLPSFYVLLGALITVVLLPLPQRACGRSYRPICPGDYSAREDVLGVTTVPACKHDILTHGSPPPEPARLSTREADSCVERIRSFLLVEVSFFPDHRPRRQSRWKSRLQGRSGIDLPCTCSERETTALATVDECAVTFCNQASLPCIDTAG